MPLILPSRHSLCGDCTKTCGTSGSFGGVTTGGAVSGGRETCGSRSSWGSGGRSRRGHDDPCSGRGRPDSSDSSTDGASLVVGVPGSGDRRGFVYGDRDHS